MRMTLPIFLQNLANGILLGGLYALIAIGYSMVYGILRLINFAHGDVFMMGTYFAFYGVTLFLLPWWLAFVVAIIGAGILGFLIDRIAYKPLRNAPRISSLITAIGMSIFLESLAVVIFGGIPKSFAPPRIYPKFFSKMLQIGSVRVQILTFFILGITALLIIFLIWFVYKTKIGMAMRAISTDIATTALMGVNVDLVIGITFAIGSALAGAGGILWAMKYPNVNPYMGFMPGLKAFIAAVIGGIGSIQGAMLGGFLLGMIEIMLVAFLPRFAGYRDIFAFIILIIILMYKPSGILGAKLEEKV
ncbi:MAG: branched-chain amino acid transport system permease protein [Thermotogaceae bacterium]|nr:branched-chain amino acid transport system permease protein [Thermotogaceae bacterium]MDN5338315.1 branched-chain amino acid transport system permease protein [Thermotogaceae bacterium]